MIKIETVLNILKEDHNFREILQDGEYHYSASGVSFLIKLATIVERSTPRRPLFCQGANFKKEFFGASYRARSPVVCR